MRVSEPRGRLPMGAKIAWDPFRACFITLFSHRISEFMLGRSHEIAWTDPDLKRLEFSATAGRVLGGALAPHAN
jgi:hypothetical protein